MYVPTLDFLFHFTDLFTILYHCSCIIKQHIWNCKTATYIFFLKRAPVFFSFFSISIYFRINLLTYIYTSVQTYWKLKCNSTKFINLFRENLHYLYCEEVHSRVPHRLLIGGCRWTELFRNFQNTPENSCQGIKLACHMTLLFSKSVMLFLYFIVVQRLLHFSLSGLTPMGWDGK